VRFVHSRRAQLSSLVAEHVVALPGHELEMLGALEPDELVVVSSEVVLSGQGAEAARRLGGRRVLFLTDYANQRGVVEAGLHPTADGLSAWEMLNAAAEGRLKALLVFADDPFEFFPAVSARAFARAELTLVVDAVKTGSGRRADLVVPGALLAEKHGTVVNTEGRAQEITPAARPPAGWTEGSVATVLMQRFDGEAELPPPPPCLPGPGGLLADRPSADYPFLAALDTTLFWNSHPLITATVTAWREARSLFADFPPGCVTLNPDDARALGVQYASAVNVASADGSVTLPARLNPRMLPGTVWIAMPCWERCGAKLGALEFDPSLRIPVFRPRAVRIARPPGR
jgi:anaerobic selenocysteine-containing dehydrogenase